LNSGGSNKDLLFITMNESLPFISWIRKCYVYEHLFPAVYSYMLRLRHKALILLLLIS